MADLMMPTRKLSSSGSAEQGASLLIIFVVNEFNDYKGRREMTQVLISSMAGSTARV